jgi:hypothetical protein
MPKSSQHPASSSSQGNGSEDLKESIDKHLKYSQAKNWQTSTPLDQYNSVAPVPRWGFLLRHRKGPPVIDGPGWVSRQRIRVDSWEMQFLKFIL